MQLREAEENKHKTFLASVTIVSNDAKPEYRCTTKHENGKVRHEMSKSVDDAKNVCEEKKGRMGVR